MYKLYWIKIYYSRPSKFKNVFCNVVPFFSDVEAYIQLSVRLAVHIILIPTVLPSDGKNPVFFSWVPLKLMNRTSLVHSYHILTTVMRFPIDAMAALKNDQVRIYRRHVDLIHDAHLELDMICRHTSSSSLSSSLSPSVKNALAILVHRNPLSLLL